MDHGAAVALGTAPPQDGEQPSESSEPLPPWPPPQLLPPGFSPLHAPSPEPAQQFCLEPTPEPCPEMTPVPATDPVPEPNTEPAPKPSPEPATELDTQRISEPAPELASQPTPVPAIEPTPDRAPESAPEPGPELATESCPKPSPALHLLQCPVITPETGLKTSASPRMSVPLSSIKVRKRLAGASEADDYQALGTLNTLSIPFHCHRQAKMLRKMRGLGEWEAFGSQEATCGSESELFGAKNEVTAWGGNQSSLFSPQREEW